VASRGFIRGGREVFGFWVITLGLCVLAGVLSYGLGRDWVGRTLGEAISSENVQIKPQTQSAQAPAATEEQTGPPPAQVRVELESREPTEGEKQDLTAQKLAESAENGESTGAGSEPTPSPASTSPESAAVAATSSDSYQVTAGSFTVVANAERVKRDLQKLGYKPRLMEIKRRGTTYNRVVVGDYDDKQKAEAVKQDLEAAGFVAGITRG